MSGASPSRGWQERTEEILGRPLKCGVDRDEARAIAIAIIKEGATRREAGELLGIPERTVAEWARKELGRCFTREGRQVGSKYSDELRDAVLEKSKQGMSYHQIGREFGINPSTVSYWMRKDAPCPVKAVEYKARHQFHRIHNPNYDLAPLNHLWIRGSRVVEFVRESVDGSMIRSCLGAYDDSRDRHMWEAWASGKRPWARYDRADQILCRLGLWIGELGEPTYSTRSPETVVAA